MENRPDLKALRFSYDREVDVLYVSIGDPVPATSVERRDGTVLRKDPKTGELVGWTIIQYMQSLNDGILRPVPGFKNLKMPRY
jgi:uncharacterized protein YuzE